ncbi:MAG: hydrogenase maturation protease [Euzebya sp.]
MRPRILIAGIGNIFFGDDGFGVEVIRRLGTQTLPAEVKMMDVGIRGVHLSFELMDGYDIAILVDAAPRGESPGTITILEPDVTDVVAEANRAQAAGEMPLFDSHGMGPVNVLAVLETVDAAVDRVLLVACEPADCTEGIGLSPAVDAAVDTAVSQVLALLAGELGDLAIGSTPQAQRG